MSGGTWTPADTKSPATREGIYINVVSQAQRIAIGDIGGVVFIVGRADWGPVSEVTRVLFLDGVAETFGTTGSLPKLAEQAFLGGAAEVLCLRIAASATAKKAAVILQDDNSSPKNALTLTAKYSGTRANGFAVAVKDHPVEGKLVEISEGGTLLEQFLSATGLPSDFATLINRQSALVDAAVDPSTSGSDELAGGVSGAGLTGGNSGLAVVAADYTAAQTLAEAETFGLYVQDDDTTAANQMAVGAWVDRRYGEGQRFVAVMGGPEDQTAAQARTAAEGFDSQNVVYVFPGFADQEGNTFTGQEAAARIAGLISARGYTRAITYAPLRGIRGVASRLSATDIGLGLEAGVLQIIPDGRVIRCGKGINTLTSTGGSGQPRDSFRKIRTIRTLNAIQEGINEGSAPYIGDVTNDEDGRRSLGGAYDEFLDQLVSAGAIAADPPPYSTVTAGEADQVFVDIGVTPLDSMEQIFVRLLVS